MAIGIQQMILDFYKSPEFQKLSAYYGQSTVFDVLGVQRSENRHSAFLAWLLNPMASHLLKETPLRKFLALLAAKLDTGKKDKEDKFYSDHVRQHLLSGNYRLNVETVKPEQSIVGLAGEKLSDLEPVVEKTSKGEFKRDAQNRFDIWMLLRITFTNEQDKEERWTVPIVLENKIYSTEGNAGDKKKAQTIRYHGAIDVLHNVVCEDKYYQPLLVYLTPSDAKAPTAESFIHITYQDLLDYVILPCSTLISIEAAGTETTVLINGYIRNLSCPSNKDGENTRSYSILAIAETENSDLEALYDSGAFRAALYTMYPSEAEELLGSLPADMPDELPILEQFWNANENLFKIVLQNHFKNDKDKMTTVRKIVKESNRDNTRYFVGLQAGQWLNTKGKPASKSEASFLIFKAYCMQQYQQNPNSSLNVNNLRATFEGRLNTYYYNRFFQHLFYDFTQEVTSDIGRHKGNLICLEINTWDFYSDDDHLLPYVEGEVRNVKMWRKSDFDKLVEKARKLGIVVEPA